MMCRSNKIYVDDCMICSSNYHVIPKLFLVNHVCCYFSARNFNQFNCAMVKQACKLAIIGLNTKAPLCVAHQKSAKQRK